MKSFKKYIVEDNNPFELGRIVEIYNEDENLNFYVLVVRSENRNGAILLVISPQHQDVGNLINSKSLPAGTEFNIINQNRIPITNYFFQSQNFAPIKRIEYHDNEKKLKEELEQSGISEELDSASFSYYLNTYRRIKNKDKINEKLNLILEILFSDQAGRKVFVWKKYYVLLIWTCNFL